MAPKTALLVIDAQQESFAPIRTRAA